MRELFPIFLKLGGGNIAALRVKQLIKAGTRVKAITPKAGTANTYWNEMIANVTG